MRKSHNIQSLYNNRILVWQMGQRGWTPGVTAQKAGIAEFSVNRGLSGTLGTLGKLRKLADALGVKWEFITHIDLPESQFRRAVLTGESDSV